MLLNERLFQVFGFNAYNFPVLPNNQFIIVLFCLFNQTLSCKQNTCFYLILHLLYLNLAHSS